MRILLLTLALVTSPLSATLNRTMSRVQGAVRALRSSPELLQEMLPDVFEEQSLSQVLEKMQSGIYALEETYHLMGEELSPRVQILIHQTLGCYQELSPQALAAMDEVDAQEAQNRLQNLTKQLFSTVSRSQNGAVPLEQLSRIVQAQESAHSLLAPKGYKKACQWKKFTRNTERRKGIKLFKAAGMAVLCCTVMLIAYRKLRAEMESISIKPITQEIDGHIMRIQRHASPSDYLGVALIARNLHDGRGEVLPYTYSYAHRVYDSTRRALQGGERPYSTMHEYNIAALLHGETPHVCTDYGAGDPLSEFYIYDSYRMAIARARRYSRNYLESLRDAGLRSAPPNLRSLNLGELNDLVAQASTAMIPADIWDRIAESGVPSPPRTTQERSIIWGSAQYVDLLADAETRMRATTVESAHSADVYLSGHRESARLSTPFATNYEALQTVHLETDALLGCNPVTIQEHESHLSRLATMNSLLRNWTDACLRTESKATHPSALSVSSSSTTIAVRNPLCDPRAPAPKTTIPTRTNPLWEH